MADRTRKLDLLRINAEWIPDKRMIDISGDTYERLTVVKPYGYKISKNGSKTLYWLCKCSCGNETLATARMLKQRYKKSCGCLQAENRIKSGKLNRKYFSKDDRWLASELTSMKKRCYNKENKDYRHYGVRGIILCDEWLKDVNSFITWAKNSGFAMGLTIDRIDVNGNYEPSNCRWATWKEQNNNKRNTVKIIDLRDGLEKPISEIAEDIGIKYTTFYMRLKKFGNVDFIYNSKVGLTKGDIYGR